MNKKPRVKKRAVRKAKVLYDGPAYIAPSTAKYRWKQYVGAFTHAADGDIKVRIRVSIPLPPRTK